MACHTVSFLPAILELAATYLSPPFYTPVPSHALMADMRSMARQERGLQPSYVCFRELGENAIYDTGLECASYVITQLIAAVYLAAAVGAGGHSLAKVSLHVQCSELPGLLILAYLQVDDIVVL